MAVQKVYLIRHGEVDGNILHLDRMITVGAFNELLTTVPHEVVNTRGLDQINQIVPQVASFGLSCLYVSPLMRAQQTAQILAEATGLPLITHPELYELLPAPILKTPERIYKLRNAYIRSGLRMLNPLTRDTETFMGAFLRVRRVFKELIQQNTKDFGIVGHQGIFRSLFIWIHMTPCWRLVQGDTHNAGISILSRRC